MNRMLLIASLVFAFSITSVAATKVSTPGGVKGEQKIATMETNIVTVDTPEPPHQREDTGPVLSGESEPDDGDNERTPSESAANYSLSSGGDTPVEDQDDDDQSEDESEDQSEDQSGDGSAKDPGGEPSSPADRDVTDSEEDDIAGKFAETTVPEGSIEGKVVVFEEQKLQSSTIESKVDDQASSKNGPSLNFIDKALLLVLSGRVEMKAEGEVHVADPKSLLQGDYVVLNELPVQD